MHDTGYGTARCGSRSEPDMGNMENGLWAIALEFVISSPKMPPLHTSIDYVQSFHTSLGISRKLHRNRLHNLATLTPPNTNCPRLPKDGRHMEIRTLFNKAHVTSNTIEHVLSAIGQLYNPLGRCYTSPPHVTCKGQPTTTNLRAYWQWGQDTRKIEAQ